MALLAGLCLACQTEPSPARLKQVLDRLLAELLPAVHQTRRPGQGSGAGRRHHLRGPGLRAAPGRVGRGRGHLCPGVRLDASASVPGRKIWRQSAGLALGPVARRHLGSAGCQQRHGCRSGLRPGLDFGPPPGLAGPAGPARLSGGVPPGSSRRSWPRKWCVCLTANSCSPRATGMNLPRLTW